MSIAKERRAFDARHAPEILELTVLTGMSTGGASKAGGEVLWTASEDPRVTWINVWADEEANRVVRELNDGNELTPTALVGSTVLQNPSKDRLLAALTAPDRFPDGSRHRFPDGSRHRFPDGS